MKPSCLSRVSTQRAPTIVLARTVTLTVHVAGGANATALGGMVVVVAAPVVGALVELVWTSVDVVAGNPVVDVDVVVDVPAVDDGPSVGAEGCAGTVVELGSVEVVDVVEEVVLLLVVDCGASDVSGELEADRPTLFASTAAGMTAPDRTAATSHRDSRLRPPPGAKRRIVGAIRTTTCCHVSSAQSRVSGRWRRTRR